MGWFGSVSWIHAKYFTINYVQKYCLWNTSFFVFWNHQNLVTTNVDGSSKNNMKYFWALLHKKWRNYTQLTFKLIKRICKQVLSRHTFFFVSNVDPCCKPYSELGRSLLNSAFLRKILVGVYPPYCIYCQ